MPDIASGTTCQSARRAFFFFNETATTEIYTLSLHDALPIFDLPNFFRKPHGSGWALVGDAGYHKDPYGAQGISDAFRDEIGRAHVSTPVTPISRMPASA